MQETAVTTTAAATADRPEYALDPEPSVRIIRPVKRRVGVSELWRSRGVTREIATRDFKSKYKQSVLGPLWLVFQPIALLLAFLVAFRGLADVQTSGVPYSVFALAGLTAWAFVQAALTIGAASLVSNINYIRFTPCPRPAFPLAAMIASLPAFVVTGLGAIVAAAIAGRLSPKVVLLPFGLLWLLLLMFGVVAILSALAVRYRDIISALPFLLQVGLFLAPVGYSLAELSSTVRVVVELNPLTGVIEGLRWMMLTRYEVPIEPVAISLAFTAVLLVVGWRLFTRLETTMADDI
jgi:lipopolysaccharide transport system permease protein